MRNVTSCSVYEIVLGLLSPWGKMGCANSAQVIDMIHAKCNLENEARYHLGYLSVD
jgi:hypothetical protein